MKSPIWSAMLSNLASRGIIPGVLHRLLLYGPPGTGKSSWASTAFPGRVERVTLHRQMFSEDLVGGYQLKQGETVWCDGPALRCLRGGLCLVLDEIDQFSPEIRCQLHAMLDDLSIAGITLPTGERVRPAPGFCVVATSNESPDKLPPALRDRFDLVVYADVPADGLLDTLPKGAANLLRNHYAREDVQRWTPPVSARSLLALHRLDTVVSAEEAAALLFGPQASSVLSAIATAE